MNTVTVAHIGGELLVISGVAFYFHRKTSQLQAEVDVLKKENEDLINSVNELQEQMQQLANFVMQSHHPQQMHQRHHPNPQAPSKHPHALHEIICRLNDMFLL